MHDAPPETTDTSYNGHASWETWLIASSVFDDMDVLQDWLDAHVPRDGQGNTGIVADAIKAYIQEDMLAALRAESLAHAACASFLKSVNWRELAEYIMLEPDDDEPADNDEEL